MIFLFVVCLIQHAWIAVAESEVDNGDKGQMKLPVSKYENDPAYHYHSYTTFDKALQGLPGSDAHSCYVGNMPKNGWAKVYFNQVYKVERLRFLNRDNSEKRIEGIEIDVCSTKLDDSCQRCGTTGVTGASEWIEVVCPTGIQGDLIKLINKEHYLSFCELEIYGRYLVDGQMKLTVDKYENDPAYHHQSYATFNKALDGVHGTDPHNCYVGNMPKNGWATLYFNQVQKVERLLFLNRDIAEKRIEGIEIDVCSTKLGGSCQKCGTTGVTGRSEWIEVVCPAGIQGDIIKLINKEHYLSFCELEIYGRRCSYCGDYHRACPAITDSTYAEKLEQGEAADLLSLKKLPTPISCDNTVYKTLCPWSCKECVPCA